MPAPMIPAGRLPVLRGAGAEVAAHLGVKVAAVYVARSRVQAMLEEEIDRLE
jgi:hypothetical protein